MKQNKTKPRNRKPRSGKVILITAVVFLIAGAAAIIIPVAEESETLNRDEIAYEELADELKIPREESSFPPIEDVVPQTEPVQEEPDTTAIHPPNADETSQPEMTGENEQSEQLDAALQQDEPEMLTQEPVASTSSPTQLPSKDETHEVQESYGNTGANLNACTAKNADFVAWLKIPGTNIDYPVVLTDSPDYYLTHSFTGQTSKLGTLFSLGKTDYQTPGQNIAIYGHHITNTSGGQKMFRPLLSYKQKSFWEKHSIVYLDSLYHISTYRIFAVIDMVAGEWDPSTAAFSNDEAFLDFIRQAQSQSLYDTGVKVSAGDHILTLITCDRSFASKEGRLVVMAVEQ